MDLARAIWRDGLSVRRAWALFTGIGPDSATHRSVSPDTWHWRNEHELLAVMAELIDAGNRAFFAAHSDKAVPRAIEIRRPGRKKTSRGTTLGEALSMFPQAKERAL